jgi:hypothetical protein
MFFIYLYNSGYKHFPSSFDPRHAGSQVSVNSFWFLKMWFDEYTYRCPPTNCVKICSAFLELPACYRTFQWSDAPLSYKEDPKRHIRDLPGNWCKACQDSQAPNPYIEPIPLELEAEMSTTQSRSLALCQNRLSGTHSLLFSGYRGCFPGCKVAGASSWTLTSIYCRG